MGPVPGVSFRHAHGSVYICYIECQTIIISYIFVEVNTRHFRQSILADIVIEQSKPANEKTHMQLSPLSLTLSYGAGLIWRAKIFWKTFRSRTFEFGQAALRLII